MTPFRAPHIRSSRFSLSRIRRIPVPVNFISALLISLLLVPSLYAADYSTGVTAKVLTKTMVTGNGEKIRYPLTDKAEVTAMTVDLAPGAETGWHKHPVPVYAYVIAGNLSVELEDGTQLAFKAGDVIIEVVNTLHNGRNMGAEPVKLAVFYLGVEGSPNVIKPEQVKKPN